MASRLVVERVPLKTLQKHHHNWLNTFGDQETLIDAVGNRPGFFGANPIAFLSLVARRPSIQLGDLDEALVNDRTLIRASAFRGSLFLINTQDYPIYFRTFNQGLFQRGLQKLADNKISKNHLYYFADLLHTADPSLPLSIPNLMEILYDGRRERPSQELAQRIVQKLCDMGVLIRATAKGWKGNDFNYALFKKWVPEISIKPDNPETARTETIRKYLRAYGPASIEDISWWTGLSIIQCQRSVGHLRREAIRFHIDTYRDDMIGLKETVELLRKKSSQQNEIQLLPPWDPYTLGWRCRKRIADKEVLPFIYDANGNATSVIVDCGKVIGLWQFRDNDSSMLEYHIFSQYRDRKKTAMPIIEEWAQSLTKLSGSLNANIIERAIDAPLCERPAGSFLWPLGKYLSASKTRKEIVSPMERRTSNTFRQRYLDNEFLIRPNVTPTEQNEADVGAS
ncbi:MAG: winged helix DNA-binding domain-containing protein [Myxococcales bacterium]|nr:winged helix DNA-binding domain-containing protein [Myxococcales bacterium]USN50332.1 MAG: winged helix DNA-binding domain-containing protein [Myxococcales bacterium]